MWCTSFFLDSLQFKGKVVDQEILYFTRNLLKYIINYENCPEESETKHIFGFTSHKKSYLVLTNVYEYVFVCVCSY